MFSSFSRRRVAALLALTCLLLITLDRNDNAAISALRRAFSVAVHPFETAGRVIARPVERAWDGVVHADDLRRENEALKDEIGYQRGATVEAVAAELQWTDLQRLTGLDLPSKYKIRLGTVIGDAPGNYQNTVEINIGANAGLKPGMPVVVGQGLAGRIRTVRDTTSTVLLISDPDYAVGAEALMSSAKCVAPPTQAVPGSDVTAGTGQTASEGSLVSLSSEVTPGTGTGAANPDPAALETVPDPLAADTLPPEGTPDTGTPGTGTPGTGTGTPPATPSTEDPTAPDVVRETGTLRGQTFDKPLRFAFIDDTATSRIICEGARVQTAGGSSSNAPPGLPIGKVTKVERQPGGGPPIIEVTPWARLTQLKFVAILLFVPSPAAPGA